MVLLLLHHRSLVFKTFWYVFWEITRLLRRKALLSVSILFSFIWTLFFNIFYDFHFLLLTSAFSIYLEWGWKTFRNIQLSKITLFMYCFHMHSIYKMNHWKGKRKKLVHEIHKLSSNSICQFFLNKNSEYFQ